MTEYSIDAAIARAHMVDSQVRPNQVNDARVIAAMRRLPREHFAPAASLAYSDADIDLGGGRWLLAPMLIARLTQLVLASNPAHVLVVGAGSGYGAAILASAGADVTALESETRLNTGALPASVKTATGPLAAGWPASGPYEVIFIEGAVPAIPAGFAAQMAPGGRIITILADQTGSDGNRAAFGRAAIAQPSGDGFATTKVFDCAARVIPEFKRAPAFVF